MTQRAARSRGLRFARLLAAALLAQAWLAGAAYANWTRKAGDRVLISTVSLHVLETAADRPDLIKSEAALYYEAGVTNAVTLIARSAAQHVSENRATIRRVVVIDGEPVESVIRPRRGSGVGGIELGARVRLWRSGPWAASAQGVFGIPGSGENQINEPFGEGGGDTDLRLQVGRALPGGGFVAASGGWRNRRGEVVDEVRLDLTAGRPLGRGVHAFLQSYSVWADGDGPRGQSGYSGHRVQASILLPVSRRMRLQAGALTTLYAENMAEERAVLISLWRRF